MIHRGSGEIRVERDEQDMWMANGMGGVAVLIVAVLPVLSAKPPAAYYVIPLAILVAGSAFFVYLVRARDVCIIRSDRIGHGSVDGPIRWIPRDEVGSVELSRTPFFQLDFYDRNGKTLDSTTLRFFSDRELVEAFESVGIPVKAPRAVRHQARHRG